VEAEPIVLVGMFLEDSYHATEREPVFEDLSNFFLAFWKQAGIST